MGVIIPNSGITYKLQGGKLTVSVTIQNTGNVRYTFYVGATVAKGIAGSGCNLYVTQEPYYDLPLRSITLDPNQSGTVTWEQSMTLSEGTWYLIVKVWKSSTPRPEDCLAGTSKSFTVVIPRPAASIVSVSVTYA